MKAALAGAAAAAVWQAPRIEGLSVAPDVAQAASCTGGTATPVRVDAIQFNRGGLLSTGYCWGNVGSGGCTTANARTVNLPIAGNNFAFGASVVLSGFAANDGNSGAMAVTVNGIDPPFRTCTFSVDQSAPGSDCSGAIASTVFFSNPTSLTFVNNSTGNIPTFGCNVAPFGILNAAHVTVRLTCTSA